MIHSQLTEIFGPFSYILNPELNESLKASSFLDQDGDQRLRDDLTQALVQLRHENVRLLQELVDTQRNYQDQLRSSLTEQLLLLRSVSSVAAAAPALASASASASVSATTSAPSCPPPQSDPALATWLTSAGASDAEVDIFVSQVPVVI